MVIMNVRIESLEQISMTLSKLVQVDVILSLNYQVQMLKQWETFPMKERTKILAECGMFIQALSMNCLESDIFVEFPIAMGLRMLKTNYEDCFVVIIITIFPFPSL